MAIRPLRCPSCGGPLPGVGTACPACGFTVWRADGGWDDRVFRGSGAAAAGTATGGTTNEVAGGVVDTVVDDAADDTGGGRIARWATTPPSPPPNPRSLSSITPPSPAGLPPSQVSVDALAIDWSNRFSLRAGWGARAPASGGRRSQAAATRSIGAPSGPVSGAAAAMPSAGGCAPGARRPGSGLRPADTDTEQDVRAAARVLRRRGDLSAAAGVAAPAIAPPKPLPVVGFDQVLSSDFRGAASISGGGPFTSPSPAVQTRRTPLGASAIEFPAWVRAVPGSARAVRARSRSGRAPLSRAGVWLGAIALLVVGLLVFTGYAQRWSGGTVAASGGAPSMGITMPAPRSADRATVRRELVALAAIAAPPSAHLKTPRPTAALRARRLRVRLILWRDRFDLTAHQSLVLDHAVAYAGTLDRWLTSPRGAARRAAALAAWRDWRADDPFLKTL